MDGTKMTEQIIGQGQVGLVVSRGGYAVKIPKIERILEIDGVPRDSGRLTPEEGGYDPRTSLIELLQREKAIYRRLGDYSGVIQCLNRSSTDPEIQMPLMGDDLRHFLAKVRPEKQRQLSWILQMAHTLAYVHSQRVLICDVRLDNFMVDDQTGKLKLIDFSNSTLMPLDWNLEGGDHDGYTILTDIGQLGVAMFDMITGQRCSFDLFQEWDDTGVMTWPRRDTLPSTSGVWLGHIIEKCWNQGYKSAMELVEELNNEGVS